MIRYILGRATQMVPVVFLISIMVFALTVLLPGDPTVAIVGEFASDEQRRIAIEQYGFDQPVYVQYERWMSRLVQGDLGRSLRTREPILEMLQSRLPVTFELAVLSTIVAMIVGIPLGVVAALRQNTWVDTSVSATALVSLAIPNFWAGILLIYLFSLWLDLLPPSGHVAFAEDPLAHLKLMIMPTLALGTALAALVMRQTRASMLEVLSADFIRTAQAKGLKRRRILIAHALPNSLIPLATIVGLQFGHLLGGAVIVETIFNLPGLGRMLIDGIFTRDAPAVQGAILFIVFAVLIVNLLTDLVYTLIDPRIDLAQSRK